MLLLDVMDDIHALNEDPKVYERKYGILSDTFYELYSSGVEPEFDDWVLDWSDWAGANKLLLRRKEQYQNAIFSLKKDNASLNNLITRTSRHESVHIAP